MLLGHDMKITGAVMPLEDFLTSRPRAVPTWAAANFLAWSSAMDRWFNGFLSLFTKVI